jgi:thymidylate kinase
MVMWSSEQAPRSDLIVSVSGIDGAGKTTLINALLSQPQLRGAALIPKKGRQVGAALAQHLGPEIKPVRNIMTGPIAHCIRMAYAFDFVMHYRSAITLKEWSAPIILLDRWKLDVLAWARLVPEAFPVVNELMRPVQDANVTLMLDIDPAVATQRIISREGELRAGNQEPILAALRDAYLELSRGYQDLHIIDSDAGRSTLERQALSTLQPYLRAERHRMPGSPDAST